MEMEVNETSPYYNGYIVDYGDEVYTLERPEDPTIYFIKENGGGNYITKDGDLLDALAHRVYGDSKWWHIIYASNISIIDNPLERLKGGLTLFIPNQTQFRP